MTVRDRQKRKSEDATVVNLPPIPAKDYVLYHDGQKEVTVADQNPEYDKYTSVVVIVYEEALQEHFPEYNNRPIRLETLSEQDIEHFIYPPERLHPIYDDSTDYDESKSISEISTRDFSETAVEINPSDPDNVLSDDNSSYKYKTNQSRSEEGVSTEDNNKEKTRSSSVESETAIESASTVNKKHPQKTDETAHSTEDENREPIPEPSESEINEPSPDVEAGITTSEQTSAAGFEESVSEESQNQLSFDELRKRAKENEVEEVTQATSTATTEKTQYNRSPVIKKYVKRRADGYCEGCGEPAPFTNKTGNPYLHAHHIHELSDGGSDTLDTVIALCPNCHYRVHHGEDGDEYNQKLEEKLESVENQSNST